MKKLLNVLGAVLILGSSTTAVVACGGKPKGNDDANLTDLQKNMLSGAEFMTKVILAGRHENLNYNVNEVLSTFMTPISTLSNIPLNYNDPQGNPVDLASSLQNYKNLLAPAMTTWDQDNYAGFYASYIMGMYDDDFYKGFLDNGYFADTMNAEGGFGINQEKVNALGYAAGLNKSIHLNSDKDRRALAWGIQDTGPLTNYLLNNGLDGGYPDDSSGTANPHGSATQAKGGTNSSGYLFYNSLVAASKAKQNGEYKKENLLNKKFTPESGLSLEDQSGKTSGGIVKNTDWTEAHLLKDEKSESFGETGALFATTGSNLNVNGYSTTYTGLMNMISESESGATVLGKFLDGIFPILKDTGSSSTVQIIGESLWLAPILSIYGKPDESGNSGFADGILDELKSLDNGIDWKQFENIKLTATELPSIPPFGDPKTPMINEIFADDNSVTVASNLFEQIYESFINASEAKKDNFYNTTLKASDGGLGTLISKLDNVISPDMVNYDTWNKITSGNHGQAGINLLHTISRAIKAMGKYSDAIKKAQDSVGGKPYKKMSISERNNYLKFLGWNAGTGKFDDDSFLKDAYNTLKSETGSSEFASLLASFADITSNKMAKPHDELIKYMTGDDYWKESNVEVSVKDNKQLGGKMSFTLDYTGHGDSSSNADQQSQAIDPDMNFNPYQTIYKYQSEKLDPIKGKFNADRLKTSGKVLGATKLGMKDDALKAYDGTGMLANMQDTHHQYKVTWENVGNKNSPYWVITSIHSFNDKGEEFYNIY
jgi:hypothetical protein